MRVAFVGLAVIALTSAARAQEPPRDETAIGVVVQGGGTLRAKVEDHLSKRLRREGYTANDEPLSKDALNTIANCFIIEDLACAKGVFEARSRTPRLVFARIDDSTGAVTLDFTWFAKGRAPISAKTSCSNCAATWQDHTDDLFHKLTTQAEMPIISATEVDPEATVHKPRSKFWSRALVGVGAATLVTSGVLLYYGLRDGQDYKYVYPRLTPVGISLFAVGGGALIGGIITW